MYRIFNPPKSKKTNNGVPLGQISAGDMPTLRRLEKLGRRLTRMQNGFNEREKDVIERWNARKQKRLLQQNVRLRTPQTISRKI